MIETATGLILRTYPLTETSVIVHWLTSGSGRLATVAKGARNPKSSFRGKLDLFYLADFSFSRSRRSELHTLREVKLRDTHPVIRKDLAYLQQASYCAALVELTTESETPLSEVFDLLLSMLSHLGHLEPTPRMVFAFEIKLLRELGLEPNLKDTGLGTSARTALGILSESEWAELLRMPLSPADAQEIRRFLHGFLIYHLGRIPKGRSSAVGEA